MFEKPVTPGMDLPVRCQILVQGVIGERWRDWFAELDIAPAGVEITCLSGVLPDQAALLGLLQKLYNLGYPLLRVEVESAV